MMPFPTYAASTELDAVNQILSSVGQAPVTTLDLQNPEVSIAVNTLREQSKQVQLEKWSFNTEHNYELFVTPIQMRSLIQQMCCHWMPTSIITKITMILFDVMVCFTTATNIQMFLPKISRLTLLGSLTFKIYHLQFSSYITAKAARMCATKMVGDAQLNQLLQEQEATTRAAAIEEECQQGDYSMFGFRDGANYYNSYQPFQALSRQ